jgi:hypothetical protein
MSRISFASRAAEAVSAYEGTPRDPEEDERSIIERYLYEYNPREVVEDVAGTTELTPPGVLRYPLFKQHFARELSALEKDMDTGHVPLELMAAYDCRVNLKDAVKRSDGTYNAFLRLVNEVLGPTGSFSETKKAPRPQPTGCKHREIHGPGCRCLEFHYQRGLYSEQVLEANAIPPDCVPQFACNGDVSQGFSAQLCSIFQVCIFFNFLWPFMVTVFSDDGGRAATVNESPASVVFEEANRANESPEDNEPTPETGNHHAMNVALSVANWLLTGPFGTGLCANAGAIEATKKTSTKLKGAGGTMSIVYRLMDYVRNSTYLTMDFPGTSVLNAIGHTGPGGVGVAITDTINNGMAHAGFPQSVADDLVRIVCSIIVRTHATVGIEGEANKGRLSEDNPFRETTLFSSMPSQTVNRFIDELKSCDLVDVDDMPLAWAEAKRFKLDTEPGLIYAARAYTAEAKLFNNAVEAAKQGRLIRVAPDKIRVNADNSRGKLAEKLMATKTALGRHMADLFNPQRPLTYIKAFQRGYLNRATYLSSYDSENKLTSVSRVDNLTAANTITKVVPIGGNYHYTTHIQGNAPTWRSTVNPGSPTTTAPLRYIDSTSQAGNIFVRYIAEKALLTGWPSLSFEYSIPGDKAKKGVTKMRFTLSLSDNVSDQPTYRLTGDDSATSTAYFKMDGQVCQYKWTETSREFNTGPISMAVSALGYACMAYRQSDKLSMLNEIWLATTYPRQQEAWTRFNWHWLIDDFQYKAGVSHSNIDDYLERLSVVNPKLMCATTEMRELNEKFSSIYGSFVTIDANMTDVSIINTLRRGYVRLTYAKAVVDQLMRLPIDLLGRAALSMAAGALKLRPSKGKFDKDDNAIELKSDQNGRMAEITHSGVTALVTFDARGRVVMTANEAITFWHNVMGAFIVKTTLREP